jgi:hypothetical protein
MAVQEFEVYENLIYTTPEIPKKIRGQKLKPVDQVWTRHTEYEQWGWNDDPKNGTVWWEDPEPGQLEWYYAEIDRILNGEWVMIEGNPTFLNNFAYFYFQWFVTKENTRPEYKDTCLLFMRFLELVFKDPKCRGGNTMKGRRKHVSTMCMSVILQFGLIMTNIEQGITSKSAVDAEKIFQLMFVNGYAGLPSFLKPRISGNDLPKTRMHIIKKAGSITKGQSTGASKEGLNNKVEWRAPGLNVFDGDGLWILLLDEAGKWEEIAIDEYLVTASQIIHAGKQVGRILIITTVNKGDKGGESYKVVWKGSDQTKLNILGQTDNKLYRLFIPGYMGGRDGGWIDKYGNSVWDTPTAEQTEWLKNDPNTLDPYMGCKAYCELQRKLLANDPEKLQEEIRMFPFNPEEVFNTANSQCHFNIKDLNDQIELIESRCDGKKENGRRMSFKMKDSGEKYPVDDPNGMWYILELIETPNKSVFKGSIKCPDNVAYGAAGLDTYANSRTSVEKGSDACLVVTSRYNYLDPEKSYMPVAMFLGKPETKEIFHTQIQYGLEYYGIKMLAERSPTDWEDWFIKYRLASPLDAHKKQGYLITTKRYDDSEVYGATTSGKETMEQHLTVMVEYALNNMHKIQFLRILKDMLKFNIKDRTDYDGCMAFGYSLMALLATVKVSNKIEESKMSILPVWKPTEKSPQKSYFRKVS